MLKSNNVAAILKMATGRNFSMSGINSGHHNLLTYEMSLKLDNVEIVRYCGGQCWICAVLWWPFWKWRPVEIFQCRDIIIYTHIKFWWYRTMLNFYGIVAAILKLATGRNFSMSGINIYPHIKFWWYRQCWIFTTHFLCRVLAAILKMVDISKILKTQNCSSNGDLSLCQILCLYHYPFRSCQH